MRRLQKSKFLQAWTALRGCLEDLPAPEDEASDGSKSDADDDANVEAQLRAELSAQLGGGRGGRVPSRMCQCPRRGAPRTRIVDLRRQLHARHATTGQLFSWCNEDRGETVT